jgi:hypothetical protein
MEINIEPRHSVFAIHHPKYQQTSLALHSPVGLTVPAGVIAIEEFFYRSTCS